MYIQLYLQFYNLWHTDIVLKKIKNIIVTIKTSITETLAKHNSKIQKPTCQPRQSFIKMGLKLK